MVDGVRIVFGLLMSLGIGGIAYWKGSLTRGGWAGAVLTGTMTVGFGGWSWGLLLITFFSTSTLLSRYKERLKEERAAEKFSKGGRRDFAQTLANGGLGALLALLFALLGEPILILAAFIGVLATVTADTWATELGVLSKSRPRLITTGQPVEPGTSGGVTPLGTSAAAAGGLLIGVAMFLFTLLFRRAGGTHGNSALPSSSWWMIPAGFLGGLAGSMADSVMGATTQAMYRYPNGKETERRVGRDGTPNTFVRGWRWLDNDMVNFLSSIIGGIVAVGVCLLLFRRSRTRL